MKNRIKGLISAFTMMLFPLMLIALSDNIKFENISIKNGLSQNSIFAITQDHYGFIWFGTEDGLNRYDGYKFKIYKPGKPGKNSISHNYIWSLLEDSKGNLWVGTNGGGLNLFNHNSEKFTVYKSIEKERLSISCNFITTIYEDSSGDIWVGTQSGGLNRIVYTKKNNRKIRSFECFKDYKNQDKEIELLKSITDITEGIKGEIWFGTPNGLYFFNKKSLKIKRFYLNRIRDGNKKGIEIFSILSGKRNNLWVGTNLGLFKISGNKRLDKIYLKSKKIKAKKNIKKITKIIEDRNGKIWAGMNSGIAVYNESIDRFEFVENYQIDNARIKNREVRSVFSDEAGVIWVGTEGGGLFKYSPYKNKFNSIFPGNGKFKDIKNSSVWALKEDLNGNVWVGTDGGGLIRIESGSSEHKVFLNDPADQFSLGGNIIKSICEDSLGNLWIGTEFGGLNLLNEKSGTFTRYINDPSDPESLSHNHIRTILSDKRRGCLWIGTKEGGLNRFDLKKKVFKRFIYKSNNSGVSYNDIYSLCLDSYGILWIGTWGGGLNVFDPESEKFTIYKYNEKDPKSISHNLVISLCESGKGDIWIGTSGGGLNRFIADRKEFERITDKDGLPNNVIYGILEDDKGNLWLSTNRGISCFDPKKKIFKNYLKSDGLQSNEFNGNAFCKGESSGRFYFGGIKGFSYFIPFRFPENTEIPNVVITSFSLFGKKYIADEKILLTKKIKLKYKENFFSFEFSSLDFTAPEKNLYKYRLDGVDRNWIRTDSNMRIARYTSVPPGNYKFRVVGSNSDAHWNGTGAEMDVIIVPPFWMTFWFRIMMIFLTLIFFIVIHFRRVSTISKRLRSEMEMERFFIKKGISSREREVILLLLSGKNSREIEDKLFISYGTVKNHIYSIYKKLNVKNRVEFFNLFKNIRLRDKDIDISGI